LHPTFDAQLGSVNFDYDSTYGLIHSDWVVKGTAATWHVTLPANTTGWLALTSAQAAHYNLNGVSLPASKDAKPITRNAETGFELAPGSYNFSVALE
jgi:hypothetical protein